MAVRTLVDPNDPKDVETVRALQEAIRAFFVANSLNAYSLNTITAKPADGGSFAVQFGDCDGKIPNCLPTSPEWTIWFASIACGYRPRPEFLTCAWTYPQALAAR